MSKKKNDKAHEAYEAQARQLAKANAELEVLRERFEAAQAAPAAPAAAPPPAPVAPSPAEIALQKHEEILARGREIRNENALLWGDYVMKNLEHYNGRDTWKQS